MWGLARSERQDVPGTDLIMALGPVRHIPPALGSRESGLSNRLFEANTEKGLRDARTNRSASPPSAPQPEVSREERKGLTPAGLALRLLSAERNTDSHRLPIPRPTPVFLARPRWGMCVVRS